MAPWSRKPRTTPATSHSGLTTKLRFELVDEEQRALLGSYAIASAIGIVFLLLVQFGPQVPAVGLNPGLGRFVIAPPERDGPAFRNPTDIPTRRDVAGRNRAGGKSGMSAGTGAIDRAFGAAAIVGQPTNILGGVVVTRPGTTPAEAGGKTVLAHGEGGVSSMTPNRGGLGSGIGAGGDIGGVRPGGGITRSTLEVEALPVVTVDPLAPPGDVAAVGTFVRGHEAQLRFCYEEHGLRVNPALGGLVTVAVSVASNGAVSSAGVTKRSWSGPGVAESEACMLRAIRGWRLPSSAAGAGTYSLPFNFSR